MGEFICGCFFFAIGTAFLIYNEPLVQRSSEFYSQGLSPEKIENVNFFNRILCLIAGGITTATGFLMMLTSDR
jgi:hypothetical protein